MDKRVLTLQVTIHDKELAKWIWDAHISGPIHGVTVEMIADGRFKDLVHEYMNEESEF